ncbi:MAG: tetratricopeptide repeat protein [Saprospiraceae bacterium]|nr:tetratricopeptide repeat protein [Saprospiraceae bacterium]
MNKFIRATLYVCPIVLAVIADAQSPRAYENAANNALEAHDYYAAMQYFGKVLEMDPNRPDVTYRYADAARQFGAYGQAETYFQKAIDSDPKGSFPDAAFMLASVKKYLGKYDEAIRLYRRYTAVTASGTPFRKQAEQDIEQCLWAMERLTNPDRSIRVERLPDGTPNTGESDFGAMMYGDTMFYTSFRHTDWGDKNYPPRPIAKIMESVDNADAEPVSWNDPKHHTANMAVSADGRVMVFNKCDYVGKTDIVCELYFSAKTAAGWSAPVKLPANINVAGYTSTQPNIHLTAEGYYELFYASDCPGGKGGLDLWRVRFSEAGNFAKSENIAALNTTGNDATPFYYEPDKTMYFSTKGRQTIGGYDIYKSGWRNNTWQEPEHLDVPLNSSYDDLFFALLNDETVYFTSNREESVSLTGESCCYDIYKGNYLPINLKTLSFSLPHEDVLPGVLFSLSEVPAERDVLNRFSGETNESDFGIRRQKKYMVIAQKENYTSDTVYFETRTLPKGRKFTEKLYLIPEIALAVKTFHEWTKDPLNGVKVRLYETPGVMTDEKFTGAESNESKMNVGGRRMFTIIAEKEGFVSDTAVVTAEELRAVMAGSTITRNLFLTPASMSAYLPITLFFDNDQPDPRTRATTTQQSYDQTVNRYLTRREAFIQTYSANLQGAEKERAAEQLGKFFDEEILAGFVKLEDFAGNLELFLNGGARIEIMVKAFASPLATSDYNLALTQRRISSVRNYFRKFQNGIFEAYIRNGQLKVSTLPLGESAASPGVSDDARDKRRSVFSLDASRERRAEILEVRLFKN